MAVAVAPTAIPLRRAYVKFARKHLGFKALVKNRAHRKGTVHLLPAASCIVRIGQDEIAVTDGSWGYTPFKISELETMLKEAKKLPIKSEFYVNSVRG